MIFAYLEQLIAAAMRLSWQILVGGGVLLLLGWIGGTLRTRRYTQELLDVIIESTPERVEAQPRWDGFAAKIVQPMPPFQLLLIVYDAPLILNPLTALAALFGQTGGQLSIQGRFHGTPRAELAWIRRGVPGQALHPDTNVSAWIHRRIGVTKGEYATRGPHVEPLIATFIEFYLRFNPALQRVCIQQEMERQLEIIVLMQTLPITAIPHLMASTTTMGLAAAPLNRDTFKQNNRPV